jgi:hypothetical protein
MSLVPRRTTACSSGVKRRPFTCVNATYTIVHESSSRRATIGRSEPAVRHPVTASRA